MQSFPILTVHFCLAGLPAHQLNVFLSTFTKIVQEAEIDKSVLSRDIFNMVSNIRVY